MIEITKMCINDLEKIKNILISDFDDFWNYNLLKEELNSDNSLFVVAKFNNQIVGFAGIKIILDEADIMNIVVKKDFRHQGIASLLLEHLITYSKHSNLKNLTLEVNEFNTNAISLYKKFEFEVLGTRNNYYDGKFNAIIMRKKL